MKSRLKAGSAGRSKGRGSTSAAQSTPRHPKSSASSGKAAANSQQFWKSPGMSWSNTKTKGAKSLSSYGNVKGTSC